MARHITAPQYMACTPSAEELQKEFEFKQASFSYSITGRQQEQPGDAEK
ncbi:MAG: hypothetical protein IKU76_07555 [Bacteroidaceae bacterium]|nr:hypothetical protein [Bacteroidaceae bacterium]